MPTDKRRRGRPPSEPEHALADVPADELRALEALARPLAGAGSHRWTLYAIQHRLRAWPHEHVWAIVFGITWPPEHVLLGLPNLLLASLHRDRRFVLWPEAETRAGEFTSLAVRDVLPSGFSEPERSRAWVWCFAFGELADRLMRYPLGSARLVLAFAFPERPGRQWRPWNDHWRRARMGALLNYLLRVAGTSPDPALLGHAERRFGQRLPGFRDRGLARATLEVLQGRYESAQREARWAALDALPRRRRERIALRDCPWCGRGTVTPAAPRCPACGVAVPPDQFEPQWHRRQPVDPLVAAERRRGRQEDASLLRATATPRQRDILSLFDAGAKAGELPTLLGLAPSTVRTHRRRLRKKID